MRRSNIYTIVGILIGVATIILGIVFCATPIKGYHTDSVNSARFGADYYTEQYSATRAVVSNTSITAGNIRDLGKKHAMYAGSFFIIMGLLIVIHYGEAYDSLRTVSSSAVTTSLNSPTQPVSNKTDMDSESYIEKEINKYIIMYDKGLITEDELNQKRYEILRGGKE